MDYSPPRLAENGQNRPAMVPKRLRGLPYIGSSPDRQILAEALTRHLRLHPDTGIEDRGLARKQSIDAILGVLKRAMGQ